MEYHSDRFDDASLMVFKGEKLLALLPLNMVGDEVYSHQGLSYGGMLLSRKIKFKEVLGAMRAVLNFLASEGISKLHLKVIPKIYHSYPADEIDYLLFLLKANRTRVDLSSAIDLSHPIKIQSNRLEGVKEAKKLGLSIVEGNDFTSFWNKILIPNLALQHQAKPVHSLAEIEQLHSKFPNEIQQYNVYDGENIVAGATLFIANHLVHVQYISANADKQRLGSLDFLFNELIVQRFKDKRYFDFGISNENKGLHLNEGLLYWKESFGARAISHEFYTIDTANYETLDSVFI